MASIHYCGGVVVMITRRKEIELDDLYKFANSCSHTFLDRVVGKEMSCKIVNELIQYKKIEEELGIDLIMLFKALKDGFFDKNGEYHHFSNLLVSLDEIGDCYDKQSFNLKDYGKTWALTKEELL